MRACLIAAAILAGTALIGDWLLRTLAITLPAFRIAGGLLLFSIASEMVFGVRIERQSKQAEEAIEEHVRNIAAFPLAIPLMAGPGAITATVLLAGRAGGSPLLLVGLLAVVVARDGALLRRLLARRTHRTRMLGITGNVRAVAPARRAAGGARGAIRHRRRARGAARVRLSRRTPPCA